MPKEFFFPPYLLQDVFENLTPHDLAACKRVCSLWNVIITSRRRLRQKLFLPTPSPTPLNDASDDDDANLELHPVFEMIHFNASLNPAETTFDRQPRNEIMAYGSGNENRRLLVQSGIAEQYATSPPRTKLSFDVIRFHPRCTVVNPSGITVWDVVVQLAEYKSQPAPFTFYSFFRSEICRKRGYVRHEIMLRKDLLGADSVYISFHPDPATRGLFVADRFTSRTLPYKSYRFWSAFAFSNIPPPLPSASLISVGV